MPTSPPVDRSLRHQSRARSLTDGETIFAAALQAIFADGIHAFPAVAAELQARGVPQPSGGADWTEASLVSELQAINVALDAAYARDGIGA